MALLWILLGAVIATIVRFIIDCVRKTHGTLKIDRTDPEKDRYRFEINDLSNVHKKKQIVLKIDPKADLSQE